LLAICAVVGLLAPPGTTVGAEPPLKVLLIDSERAGRPLWTEFCSAFDSALRNGCESPVDIYIENLDSTRFQDPGYLDRAAAWLTEKHRGVRPDVIVTAGPETYRLISRWPDLLTAETSLVAVSIDTQTLQDAGRLPRSTGLIMEFGYRQTVRLATTLLPKTRHIAIVGGPADPGSYSHLFRSQIRASFADSYEIIDLSGLPLAEIRQRAARLPDDTVLVLTAMSVDGDGRQLTHPEVVAEIAPVANAPMFGSLTTELGHGTVGGHLFDPGASGRETAELVARILNGEPAESIEPRLANATVVAFDWRQLQRWGIPERRLPPDSVVEFEPPSVWETHTRAVLLALAIFLAQGASIAALLRSRARRRQINRELHELSGRLITAQEDERRRVARELHDDVSQRLALLAIELESPEASEHLDVAASRAQDLARDVHTIAHNLQPPRLDGAGLTEELTTFCSEVTARHQLHVDCRLPDGELHVPADIALALFRIAQEAVQNAVKHSAADEVSVELGVSPRWASITVTDDGRGFDAEKTRRRRALGITGMTERMRTLGGWLTVDSVPGEGTTVSAWVPLEGRSEGERP
jgi:signal transduction histidine kinase